MIEKRLTKPESNDQLALKKCLPVIIENIKHKSKQVIPVTYTLGKKVFAAAIFQGLRVATFQTEDKNLYWPI